MIIGNKEFINGTHIMAIINLTPDSFNKDSRCSIKDVLSRVEKAIIDGAEVIDIGAQSTRPGSTPISYNEEIERLSNSIEQIKSHFDIPISVDTYYTQVAKYALDNGADLINDIYGLQYKDMSMANVIASYNASVCIMHNPKDNKYNNLFDDIKSFLNKSVDIAINANIDKNKILLDGGIGFSKTKEESLMLLNNYEKLATLNYPLLLGASRKSLFGGEVEDRLQKTLESTYLAVKKNILFVRVHDIKENKKIIDDYAKYN